MIKLLLKKHIKSPKIFFGLFLIALFISCSQTNEERGENIVAKSIKAHGGLSNYEKIKLISFSKTIRIFNEDGSLQSELIEKQSFQLQPTFLTQIEWESDSSNHKVFYDEKRIVKTINGEVVLDSLENVKAINLAERAVYTFFQPFKLIEDKSQLYYEDDVALNDSTDVSGVKVGYVGNKKTSDKWTLYFDEENNLLVANALKDGDKISLIENIEFQSVGRLLFSKHQKSYFVDDSLNKKYLQAEYFYDIKSVNYK